MPRLMPNHKQGGRCQQRDARVSECPLLVWPPHTPPMLFLNTPLIRAYREKIEIMLSRGMFPLDFGIVKSVPTQKEGKVFDKDTIVTGEF